jgi:hypothetical protein
MQCPFLCSFADLNSLHIHNATIEYCNELGIVVAGQDCSTICFSSIKFIVSSSVGKNLSNSRPHQALFGVHGAGSTLTMEDCVLESAFESSAGFNLAVCVAVKGGQVRDACELGAPSCMPFFMLSPCTSCSNPP